MRHKYSDFSSKIDVDAFEEAIEFQFIENDGKGNDIGYCPDIWHLHKNGDTTGKFAIHRDKKVYHCWVCGGGTLLSLAMAIWDLSEDDAIDKLMTFCDESSDENFAQEIDVLLSDELKRNPITPYFNHRILDTFTQDDDILELFLENRRISKKVATSHSIRFTPSAKRVGKKGTYEGPGIIFPHFWNSRLVGWQTRWIGADLPSWLPKYTNTKDFPKRWTIYNYESVYFSPGPIIAVESIPTALFLESLGYSSIATFGGSITDEQLDLLKKCQQGIILAPDNDSVGIKSISSIAKLERYISIKVVEPIGKEDSGDDLADSKTPDEVHNSIANAIDIGLLNVH